MTKIAAIFDLDDTLLAGSSGKMMVQYLQRTGQLHRYFRRRDLLRSLAMVAGWQAGLIDPTRAMVQTAQLTRGLRVDELWELVHRWFDDMLVHAILPPARARLNWHRDQGHIPVICSASSQFSVAPVAEHLAIEHTVCTQLLSRDGLLTGELRLPLVYGAGKVHWMRQWCDRHDVNLTQSYFYSDHVSDTELLQLVAHPHAVNPQRALQRVAARQGWSILHWHQA